MNLISKKLIACVAISITAPALATEPDDAEFERFAAEQQQAFNEYQQQENAAFAQFVIAWQQAEQDYAKQVAKYWPDAALPSKTRWVKYSDDLQQRMQVDYAQGEVTVEALNTQDAQRLISQAKQQLSQLSTTTAADELQHDPVVIAFDRNIKTQSITQQPVAPVTTVHDTDTVLTPAVVEQALVTPPTVSTQGNRTIIKFKLPSKALNERAAKYVPMVQQQAVRWQLPADLIMAVIQTESSFNPLARSPIPAFGLMQIVPGSAGKDVTAFLDGQPRVLSPDYLYKAGNNIEAGSVYLHLLGDRYFRAVRDPQTKSYLVIAAYNTGPGNVAKALSYTSSLQLASAAANNMTADEVYQKLEADLPAEETKNYLRKVNARREIYQQQFKDTTL